MESSSIEGFFGPVTATLDWCEANYQFSYYIAELANTFSNLITIFLAGLGVYHASRESLPTRHIVGLMGFALVGIGSFGFHASLLYEAQLLDELPMIYVSSMTLWLLLDRVPGFTLESTRSRIQLFCLILFDVAFTWSYYIYREPVYHQLVFGALVIGTALRVKYLVSWSPMAVRFRVPEEARASIHTLFGRGAATFALGFLIWNIDNIFCTALSQAKNFVGWPLAFLLEAHSWWHVLTAYGTYLMSIGVQYLSLCIKDDHRNFTLAHSAGFPYVKRLMTTPQHEK